MGLENKGAQPYNDGVDDNTVVRSTRVVFWVFVLLVAFGAWGYFFEIDEVSTGSGKVIPTSREQIIQSLEGGIVTELNVTEGDIVNSGQTLAKLDPTKTESNFDESASKFRASLASVARLQAEVNSKPLVFPVELQRHPELIRAETDLFSTRRKGLEDTQAGLRSSLGLVRSELEITQNLAKVGAASSVEVLRLKRQKAELEMKLTQARSDYMVRAGEELAKANADVETLSSIMRGRSDSVTRLTLRSPVRGIVKDIEVTTIGGIIPPNGRLMQIVPLDEQLLIEARISPRDIAFIHPDQVAKVKITAYDYAIYGGMDGKVVTISPDTIQDEVKPEVFYYRVFIRTDADTLKNKAGKSFSIVPGMIASVDIKTGQKTVLDYLIKPMNRAREALRER
ncbi:MULTISPECIES: HlyD family efflux transporter periplasmic adaptor subunit [Pseudomonas]|uniref:HlyD family efflux transporter periplasmic adaptor subunit n=1 Tax=Pseudomonas TaxID=286 RepID=UPI0015B6E4F9|nr:MULTISPECIES: HlyD family efflux transporter periplasmic adaptor subunit [Pseudomonas]MCM8562123.1 HlyD family efflux transporter periplasmic adaptor subunit [Pseudomonas shahriarae]MDI3202893.1 HlyD family efflux transporter periplasmic adaptor subunit [Pseudomonas shahriarae]MDZ4301835.1 HlyD family efflux transporter periplasmic adaptor subunit [Pseudomonas sp.]WLH59937.1 HlyD family efflux transporter periplasmic adaptor subunit [Pseudomonas sp. FP2294]